MFFGDDLSDPKVSSSATVNASSTILLLIILLRCKCEVTQDGGHHPLIGTDTTGEPTCCTAAKGRQPCTASLRERYKWNTGACYGL